MWFRRKVRPRNDEVQDFRFWLRKKWNALVLFRKTLATQAKCRIYAIFDVLLRDSILALSIRIYGPSRGFARHFVGYAKSDVTSIHRP